MEVKSKHEKKPESGERLQKVLAQAGVASRRQVEKLIQEGRVKVNGFTVAVLGTKVCAEDEIIVDGVPVKKAEELHYYLLNKPAGVISSARDPRGRATVVDLMKNVPVRVYPVGRLDYDTSGLLIMTNDGELAHRLMHPSYGVNKTYRVWVKGPMEREALEQLRKGVELEDGKTAPAKVISRSGFRQGKPMDHKQHFPEILEVTIHEGKNRQVRRMFESVGYPVVQLERIAYGPLTLDREHFSAGNYRSLTIEEVKRLRLLVGLS
ncbi:ribosomal large subunit pseudouridine synthase B [Desulfosporosinus acididurans]|uniref:Pseudouridine synthase n=1 Tax=Desulfosporosinus acididurans TaxID=476652 RepID=A0A0J1FTR4_9FIRM|nr:pseudouridine synthase [Desulfosporosinus acididurans]KLU66677.1 ribosomal large subunit pseudouridine synthase B [Desulfosporosinus acididurans]